MIIATLPEKISFKDYIVSTPAGADPLLLADLKAHLNISGTDDDAELTRLIKAVADITEKITGRDLITKTYNAYIDYFPCSYATLEIRKSKLQNITSIKYYTGRVLTLWDASNYYNTNTNYYSQVCLVDGKTYPDTDYRKQAVKIEFTSGYGVDNTYIPEGLKQAMYRLCAFLFENKGDCNDCGTITTAKELLQSYILPSMLISI